MGAHRATQPSEGQVATSACIAMLKLRLLHEENRVRQTILGIDQVI